VDAKLNKKSNETIDKKVLLAERDREEGLNNTLGTMKEIVRNQHIVDIHCGCRN
jgi:hypothetical protein